MDPPGRFQIKLLNKNPTAFSFGKSRTRELHLWLTLQGVVSQIRSVPSVVRYLLKFLKKFLCTGKTDVLVEVNVRPMRRVSKFGK